MKGGYCLFLEVPEDVDLQVGRLGRFRFPRGRYVYAGSALGGVDARVRRHLRKGKALRWHIDYLLRVATVQAVLRVASSTRVECHLNRLALRVPSATIVAPGFGASDCACSSHLTYWGPSQNPARASDFL